MTADYATTEYGFRWGAANVKRLAEKDGYVALEISWDSALVEVWVSPTGRSGNVQVYERGTKITDKNHSDGFWRTRNKVFDRWFPKRAKGRESSDG